MLLVTAHQPLCPWWALLITIVIIIIIIIILHLVTECNFRDHTSHTRKPTNAAHVTHHKYEEEGNVYMCWRMLNNEPHIPCSSSNHVRSHRGGIFQRNTGQLYTRGECLAQLRVFILRECYSKRPWSLVTRLTNNGSTLLFQCIKIFISSISLIQRSLLMELNQSLTSWVLTDTGEVCVV